jgi:uncharacterized membrane protein
VDRRAYIDWARGIAVLLMIEAHITDAWTRPVARTTQAFRDATILGGFAAPLFLWLAGLAVALSATRAVTRGQSRLAAVEAVCRRGVEIFILAFLFRLQAFILSPGGHPVTLFRVDILNVMGPAIVVAGLAWGCSRRPAAQVAISLALAVGVAMLTPILRATPVVDRLPTWVGWYLRPSGEHTTFTLFPWAGFLLAGAAAGALLSVARPHGDRRLHWALAVTGSTVIALGAYAASLPGSDPKASFWTSSPIWFAIRVGVVMVAVMALYALDCMTSATPFRRLIGPLETLGASSLFVYWIHVELVYGYASWMIHGRLPLWGALVACGMFSVFIHRAVLARNRLVESWRARSGQQRGGRVHLTHSVTSM